MTTEPLISQLGEVANLAALGCEGASGEALYGKMTEQLAGLVGFKLLTILRIKGHWLERMHSSDAAAYPPHGLKDLRADPWLRELLNTGQPVLSATANDVRAHFPDHAAIFALGCTSVLNIPVQTAVGCLGSLNLLHEAGHFKPAHVATARLFAPLLGLAWLAQDLRRAQGP